MVEYLKAKIGHLLPYYIQLMLEEIDLVARNLNCPVITAGIIDTAFNQVLEKNKNFDDWLSRLKNYHGNTFTFINEILKHAAHYRKVSVRAIYDKANDPRFNRSEDYMDFVEQLVHDGYLTKASKTAYRFVSPFLEQFWLKKYPVYHG
jgi:hypothetical protein